MAQVSGKIIQELLLILRPFMRDKQQRQAYLELALGTNSPVLNLLVWDTSADVFIPQMVDTLVVFGEITPGKPALCALLEVVRGNVGLDKQLEIDNLLQGIREELQQSPSNSSEVSPLFPRPEFQTYLENIAQDKKYQQWSNMYTLTDAEGKVFDVGLMVQTRQPKQREGTPGEGKQEPERLPVLEGIRKYAEKDKHVLLVGKPGSGKSTALQRLLWEEAQAVIQGEKRKIPVLVELRNWDTSVETLIYKFLRRYKQRVDINKIEDLLIDEELLLLMDGLNELPSDEARDKVARFRQDYPETPMIFTTRDLGVGGSLGIDKQLEMQPLTEAQMQEFVLLYLPEQGEQMLQQLGNRLRELGETPLILKMLCDVFFQKREIPKSRGDLFRQFDSTVNKLKEEKETVPVAEGLRLWKKDLLQYLAFVMMQPDNPQANPTNFRLLISRSQADAILEDFLKGRVEYPAQKAKEWLEGLLKHCLLESKASESEQVLIQFHHQLFQEYYAAEYLLRLLPNLSDAKLKRDYLNYLKWTESIAIALTLVEDEALALRVVRLALDVDLMLGARLAGEVKEEFQEKTVGLVLGIEVPELIKVEFLGITKLEFTVNYLKNCLQSENSDVRIRAVNILVQIGNEAAGDILSTLLDDEEYYISFKAIRTLVKVGNETAVNALIYALKSEHPNVRKRAAIGLGEIGNEAAVHPLIATLNDEDAGVRFSAINALENIGNEDAVNALNSSQFYNFWKNFRLEESPEIKLEKKINNKTTVNPHTSISKDEDLELELEVKKILGNNIDYQVGIKYLISVLISLLNHQERNIRIAATEFLIKICNKTTVPSLITALQDEDSEVRWRVAEVLAQIGTEASPAINSLSTALQDENSEVRWRVAEALGNIGNEAAVNSLISALQDEDSFVRITVAKALGKIANSDILYQMWELLLSGVYEAKDIILKIQENYKFYNHEIFHSPPIEETKSTPTSSTTIINSEIVQIIEKNEGDVIGKKITET